MYKRTNTGRKCRIENQLWASLGWGRKTSIVALRRSSTPALEDLLNRTLSLSVQPAWKPFCSQRNNQACGQACHTLPFQLRSQPRGKLCSQPDSHSATGTFAFAERKWNTHRRGLPLTQLVCWKVNAGTTEAPMNRGKVGQPSAAEN